MGMVEGMVEETNGNGRDTNGMQPDHVTCDLYIIMIEPQMGMQLDHVTCGDLIGI